MTAHTDQYTKQLHGRPRVGISSCLLGERVRYDGGHKRDRFIAEVLSRHFEFVPYCPEVAIGLGVPRPTIQLRRSTGGIRAIVSDAVQRDVTAALADYGHRIGRFEADNISGYIFKSRSPSCGMARVKVYGHDDVPIAEDSGIYARAIMETQPLLPVEEEGRLNDTGLRESFIERVFVYHRWQSLQASGLSTARLIGFHAEHEPALEAHDQKAARALGLRLAEADIDIEIVAADYIHQVMSVLSKPAEHDMQADVLQHQHDECSAQRHG